MNPFLWREERSQALAAIKPSNMARHGPERGKKRPVEQLSMEGVVLQQFPSLKAASRSIGQHESNLCRAINGARKTCGGFRWRYVSREEQILAPKFGGAYSKAKANESGGVV